jgi:hypothetical protein
MANKKSFKSILDKLNIDETLTKPVRKTKPKDLVHVKDIVPLKEDYNFMADLIFLPKTKGDFKYCLSVVDLATDEFDIEPIKDKESSTTLAAIKTIFKRKHLNKPYASIRTDDGNEFKGVFQKWLYNESILHREALPARHSQVANVESLNRQLGRLFNGYMNTQEIKSNNGQVNRDWIAIVPTVREELNKFRKKTTTDFEKIIKKEPELDVSKEPLFNISDLVYRKLDRPENAIGDKLSGTFREGDFRFDRQPRKVEKILYYNGKNPYRYILNGLKNASFAENELMAAKEEEALFEVKQILSKKVINGKVNYLTWYYGELKKEASYQPESELNKFVPHLVKAFNDKGPDKKKNKKK